MGAPHVTMDAALVDPIAQRVIELLAGDDRKDARETAPDAASASSLTVADVAARYGVSRSWVYAHQRELGAIRLGSGPRPRLRFNANVVAGAIAGFGVDHVVDDAPRSRQRRRELRLIPLEPMG